jgi:hypothetical protein
MPHEGANARSHDQKGENARENLPQLQVGRGNGGRCFNHSSLQANHVSRQERKQNI